MGWAAKSFKNTMNKSTKMESGWKLSSCNIHSGTIASQSAEKEMQANETKHYRSHVYEDQGKSALYLKCQGKEKPREE